MVEVCLDVSVWLTDLPLAGDAMSLIWYSSARIKPAAQASTANARSNWRMTELPVSGGRQVLFHLNAVNVATDLAADGDLELLAVLLDVAVLREDHFPLRLARRRRAVNCHVQGQREVGLRGHLVDLHGDLTGDFDGAPLLVSLLVDLDQFALALGLVGHHVLAHERDELLAGNVPAVTDLDGLFRHQLFHGVGGAAFAVEVSFELLFVLVAEFLLALGLGDELALLVQLEGDGLALEGVGLCFV